MGDCVFCEIIAGEAPAKFLADGIHGVAIEPLIPFVEWADNKLTKGDPK